MREQYLGDGSREQLASLGPVGALCALGKKQRTFNHVDIVCFSRNETSDVAFPRLKLVTGLGDCFYYSGLSAQF